MGRIVLSLADFLWILKQKCGCTDPTPAGIQEDQCGNRQAMMRVSRDSLLQAARSWYYPADTDPTFVSMHRVKEVCEYLGLTFRAARGAQADLEVETEVEEFLAKKQKQANTKRN